MLDIARYVEHHRQIPVFKSILRDIANYSYPLLSIQAKLPFRQFTHYGYGLVKMGLGRYPLFWTYWLSLMILGARRMDKIIGWIKGRLGHTPTLGKVYKGEVR